MQRPVMDTRRIILFVIFSFSVLFLWQAWQQENAPPAPPKSAAAPAPGATPTAETAEGPAGADGRARAAGDAGDRRGRPDAERRAGRAGRPEDHDHDRPVHGGSGHGGRGAHARVAQQAPRRDGSHQAVPRAATDGGAHVRRAGRPDRRRPAQPPHAVRSAARAARACARRGPRRVEAQGDRAERRRRHAGADVPPRQLPDRRRVRRQEHDGRADLALRVFPADARHQAGDRAELDGTGVLRRPGRLQRQGQLQEGRIRRHRQARGRPRRARARSRRRPTTAGSA